MRSHVLGAVGDTRRVFVSSKNMDRCCCEKTGGNSVDIASKKKFNKCLCTVGGNRLSNSMGNEGRARGFDFRFFHLPEGSAERTAVAGGKLNATADKSYLSGLTAQEQKVLGSMTSEQLSEFKQFGDRVSRDSSFSTAVAADASEATEIA